jgi:hypothetical protein
MMCDTKEWWDRAIACNREALLRIVAVLFVRAGLDEGGAGHRAAKAVVIVVCQCFRKGST